MERERKNRRRRRRVTEKDAAKTLPSSPSHHHSSSSSDFEFITISNTNFSSSPHNNHTKPFFSSSSSSTSNLCPADELFYKGQLLPLHLSPRFSMVQTLLLSSSSSSTSSSSDTTTTTTTTTSRDSNSSNDSNSSFSASDLFLLPEPESARPSSVTEEDEYKRIKINQNYQNLNQIKKPTNKYFSLISSVFRKNRVLVADQEGNSSSVKKKMSNSAKEVISKYLKKVRPLYEKLSQKQQQQSSSSSSRMSTSSMAMNSNQRKELDRGLSQSFSENLRYPRRKNCVSSCPSSMRSSPSRGGGNGNSYSFSDSSSMEELQSAIQGAIAHCKNSMIQKKTM